MKPNAITQTIDLGNGQVITIETGVLAKQADGAVVVRYGDTMLLATVVSAKEAKDGVDFMPLTVDYREKYASTGRFPGGFFKREARPSDYEVLIMRLVDRALRPLFPDDYHADTQVMIALISSDKETMPDALACLAASAALSVSDVPFNGPVSEVRVGRVDGQFVINPTKTQLEVSDFDMIIAGSAKDIVMVEGEMQEVSEEEFLQAIELAHNAIKLQCAALDELARKVGTYGNKRTYSHETHDEDLKKAVYDFCFPKCYEISQQGIANKDKRKELFKAVREEFIATLAPEVAEEKAGMLKAYFYKAEKEAMRRVVLDKGIRLDGRKTTDIRPIWCEVGYLPGPHGSSVFTRGETQSLTTLTLGTKLDEQMIDGAFITGNERFLLHYNFPPFSTGETSPLRGTSRREVGHGNLALRALRPMLPKEDFPYTVRIVSDILESNGSSSMATVCAGTLALLDGGVKMTRPVSGIAMGMITDDQGNYAILSDILGDEDHLGDMDFKVTGTTNGITACQMDIKIDGLSHTMLSQALAQARAGRLHILEKMLEVMPAAREDYKPHVPRIISIIVPQDVIGAIIGPGGKIIQEIQKTTNSIIVIEEVNGKGVVEIAAQNKDDMEAAERRVRQIAFPPVVEVGQTYDGKVKTIMPYGAFLEIIPGTDGLLHVSEIDWKRVENVGDVLKEGDIVPIKVLEKDPKTGKYKLSRKVLLPKPEKAEPQ
jgi:polyribonucleotide nucleotidyltransferase